MLIPVKNQDVYKKYFNDFCLTITTILNYVRNQSEFTWNTARKNACKKWPIPIGQESNAGLSGQSQCFFGASIKKRKNRIFFVWLSYLVPSVPSLASLSHLSRVWRTSRRKNWERGCWLSCKDETNSAFLTSNSIWMEFNEPYCMFQWNKIHSVKIDTLPVSHLF